MRKVAIHIGIGTPNHLPRPMVRQAGGIPDIHLPPRVWNIKALIKFIIPKVAIRRNISPNYDSSIHKANAQSHQNSKQQS